MAASKKATENTFKSRLQNAPKTTCFSAGSKSGSIGSKSSSHERLNNNLPAKPAVSRAASGPSKIQVM